MLNTRNQLDKIIITAMDRFVWFVLLVVISHLVTEFTRVTGFTRGPRQDMVMVNDSSIQPIRVQNLVQYPGQEQYYNANKPYNNYASSNSNFLSNLFNQFTNNQQNGQQQPPNVGGSGTNSNILSVFNNDERTFSLRPFIDSIFEIPISTVRAVNNLVGRLTGSYQQPQQQEQQHHEFLPQRQTPPNYSSYPTFVVVGQPPYYGIQRSADAPQPKTEFEILNSIQQTSEGEAASGPSAPIRKPSPPMVV